MQYNYTQYSRKKHKIMMHKRYQNCPTTCTVNTVPCLCQCQNVISEIAFITCGKKSVITEEEKFCTWPVSKLKGVQFAYKVSQCCRSLLS